LFSVALNLPFAAGACASDGFHSSVLWRFRDAVWQRDSNSGDFFRDGVAAGASRGLWRAGHRGGGRRGAGAITSVFYSLAGVPLVLGDKSDHLAAGRFGSNVNDPTLTFAGKIKAGA